MHYAKICREAGILTSLDGGGLRSNTHELLEFIDVAIVAERLCEQMDLTPAEMLGYLKSRGCRIGGVTLGERGLVWYDETGQRGRPARPRRARRDGGGHQRRRRHLPRRLCLFRHGPARPALARAFHLRPRGLRPCHPASRQRGEPADASRTSRRCRSATRSASSRPEPDRDPACARSRWHPERSRRG